jgi:chemotaxis protein MotB
MAKAPAQASNVRPIVIRRIKKGGHGGHHGGAWKVAYADFVTAMMAFFMLLWLLANPDKVRLRGLAEYFSPAPPNAAPTMTLTSQPGPWPRQGSYQRRSQADDPSKLDKRAIEAGIEGTLRGGSAAVPDPSMRVMAAEMKLALDAAGETAEESVVVETSRDGLRISLMDTDRTSMFRPGTAAPTPLARLMLGKIAQKLGPSGPRVAIEGHTDGDGSGGEANWRLSADRAFAARKVLLSTGLAPGRLSELVAFADTRPVFPAEPGRPENRRITVVILAEAGALPSDSSFRF